MVALARIETAMAWIAATLLALTGVLLSYEVVARYVFNAPTIWAAETSQLCLIWSCPVALAWLLTNGKHIRVGVLTPWLPPLGRRVTEICSNLVILAFSAWTVWYGWDIFFDSFERGRTTGTMLDLPSWINEAAIPAGFALLALSSLAAILRTLSGGDIPLDQEFGE
jgi:TRAP-type C4-dicarboxylate transport system permease small subunit